MCGHLLNRIPCQVSEAFRFSPSSVKGTQLVQHFRPMREESFSLVCEVVLNIVLDKCFPITPKSSRRYICDNINQNSYTNARECVALLSRAPIEAHDRGVLCLCNRCNELNYCLIPTFIHTSP